MKTLFRYKSASTFNPLVSIVIPVFNGSNYLAEAIDSALNQTYKNIEILVVNDGSNDYGDTERVALSFGNKISYIQKSNGGVASALNIALHEIKGEYFSWLSHDDCYDPSKIDEQISYLSGLNELDRKRVVVYSDFAIFQKNLNQITPVKTEKVAVKDFAYWLATRTRLHGCSLLIPSQIMLIEGGFNQDLQTTQDYELWFRLALKYEFHQLQKCLLYSRQHKNQTSVLLSEVAKIEGSLLHKYFLMKLSNYNISSIQVNRWEKFVKLTFSMLRKKYFSAFFYGLELIINNFLYCNPSERKRIVIVSIFETIKAPFYIVQSVLPSGLILIIKKYLWKQ